MSDPARKVVWDDEAPQVVWDVEGGPAPAQVAQPAPEPVGMGEAAARGAGQGASLGFADEMGGFGSWLASKVHPNTTGTGGAYTGGRNQERGANAAAQKAHPMVYGAAEMAGGSAPAALLGGVGGKVVGKVAPKFAEYLASGSLGARATAGAAGGAVQGVAVGAGTSEADSAGGVALDAAVGAGLGGTVGAAIPAIPAAVRGAGKKLTGASDELGRIATEQRLAAAGVERSGFKKLRAKPGGLERYAEGADRLGIGKGGVLPQTVRQHADQADAAAETARAAKDAIVARLDGAGAKVSGKRVGDAIRELKKGVDRRSGQHIEDEAVYFDELGDLPWSEMNLELQGAGSGTKWDSNSPIAKMGKKVYGKINEAMASSADDIEPEAGKAWRAAKEDEHIAMKLGEFGENKLNQAGNRGISPTDYMAGGGAAVVAGPAAGVGAIVANKLLRSREHAVAAPLAKGAARMFGSAAGVADRAGAKIGAALDSTAGRIGAQSIAGQAGTSSAAASSKSPTSTESPNAEQHVQQQQSAATDPEFRAWLREQNRKKEGQ